MSDFQISFPTNLRYFTNQKPYLWIIGGSRKMRMEQLLFWVERIAFLSMALTWSYNLLDTDYGPKYCDHLDRFDLFWLCTNTIYLDHLGRFELFWLCTNTIYFLLSLPAYFAELLQGEFRTDESVKNPGFWLERLGLMICYVCSEDPSAQLIMKFCFGMFFPCLNVYFALGGYSAEFHQNSSPVRVERKEQGISRDIEEVLFWVERLVLVALTAYWIIFWEPETWINPLIWIVTNTIYFIIYSWRPSQGNHSTMILIRIKRFPGFWLERLLFLPLVVLYPLQPKMWVVHVSFTVVLPLSHVYFSCYGYSREVRPGVHPSHDFLKGSGKAKDEMKNTKTQQHQNMAPNQATSKGKEKQVQPDVHIDHNLSKHQNMATTSNGKERDIKEESLQIVRAMEECDKKWISFINNYMDLELDKMLITASTMEDLLRKMLGDQEERILTAIANAAILEEKRRKESSSQGDNKDNTVEDVLGKMLRVQEENMNIYLEKYCSRMENKLEEFIEKCKEEKRILEEKNCELAVKFAVAAESSQLYRDLLHDPALLTSDVTA